MLMCELSLFQSSSLASHMVPHGHKCTNVHICAENVHRAKPAHPCTVYHTDGFSLENFDCVFLVTDKIE